MIRDGFGRGYGGFDGGPGRFGPGPGRGFPGHGPFFPGISLAFAVLFVAFWVLVVVAFWQLYQKAGYEGGMSLLMLVPLVNIGALIFLAFSDWPVLKRLRDASGVDAVGGEAGEPVNVGRAEQETEVGTAETPEDSTD